MHVRGRHGHREVILIQRCRRRRVEQPVDVADGLVGTGPLLQVDAGRVRDGRQGNGRMHSRGGSEQGLGHWRRRISRGEAHRRVLVLAGRGVGHRRVALRCCAGESSGGDTRSRCREGWWVVGFVLYR